MLHRFFILLLTSLSVTVAAHAETGNPGSCSLLLESSKQSLAKYVRAKYKISDSVTLKFSKEEPVGGTCYRKITFEGTSSVRTWPLVIYLSADLRFLTDKLFDTQIDPDEEERQNAERLTAMFTAGTVPILGPANAEVTVVEFSDFECPYCRRFEQMQKEVLN